MTTEEELAETLCNNVAAREMAKQERAPQFHQSPIDVRSYWRVIAQAAIDAMEGRSNASQPTPPRKRP